MTQKKLLKGNILEHLVSVAHKSDRYLYLVTAVAHIKSNLLFERRMAKSKF